MARSSSSGADIYSQYRQQYNSRLPAARQRAKEIAASIQNETGTALTEDELRDLEFQLASGNGQDFQLRSSEPAQQPEIALPQTNEQPAQEYKRGFVEDMLLSDKPTTGLGLAIANLFANRQAANASTEVNAALAEQLTPKEDIELGKLQQQLADLRSGKAKKRSVVFGPGEMAKPYYINEDYTPEEAKAVEAKLLSDIDALNKRITSGEFSAEREKAGRDAAIAQARLAAAQKVADETKAQLGSGTERISRNLGQASTLEQVLPTAGSLVGGTIGFAATGGNPLGAAAGGGAGAAAGAIPAAKAVYNQALVQAMLPPEQGGYGADYDDAVEYAAGNVAIEFGSEALGGVLGAGAVVAKKLASKFAGGLTKKALEQSLLTAVRSRKARVVAATGAEYLSELASSAGQMGFDQLLSASHEFGTEAGRELMRENVRKEVANFGDTSLDTLIQTIAIGGPAATIGANAAYKADIAKRQTDLAPGAVQRGLANIVTREPARPTNELNLPPVREQQQQTDLFPETLPGPYSEVSQPNEPTPQPSDSPLNDPRYASQRREMLRGFRDTEMDNIRTLEDQIDADEMLKGTAAYGQEQAKRPAELADARRRLGKLNEEIALYEGGAAVQPGLGLNEPTQPKPKAPKPIQTRGGDKVIQPDGTVTSNVDEANRAQAKKLLEQEAKDDNKAIDDELKRRTALHQKNRTSFLSNVREENRGLPVEQRVEVLAQAARQWDASNPAPTREQVTLADALAAKQQSKPSGKKGGKGKPKWTPATPSAPVAQEAQAQQASAATSEIGKRIEQLAANLPKAMAMEEGGATTAAPALNIKKFVKDTSEIIRSLVKDNSQKAIDILNMEQQGKLAFVPNPESVGLDMSGNTRAAYKVENGKMYIFTDRVNPKDAVGTIIRGYHEATHAGQLNAREGRGAVMSSLLGDTKYGNAVNRVLAAAKSGNAVAKSALRATEAQLGKDGATANPDLFNKELMGHFVGEVVKARSKPLGSVAGVARDILAGARNAVRAVTGADLDVSFNDIYSAVNDLGREVVATDIKGRDSNDVLAMIYNVREGKPSPGQKRAIEEGYVYDSVDGTKKYVLSDADATMSDYQYQQLIDTASGEPIPLGDVLDHEVLYRERPEADTEVSVKVVDTLGPGAFGQYDPKSKTVLVAKSALKKGKDYVLGAIMHEVQHYVQHMDGRAQQFFENDASGKMKAAEKKLASAARQNDLAANSMIDTAMRKYRGTDVGDSIQDVVNNLNLKEPIKARLVAEILAEQPKLDSKLKEFYDDYIDTRNKHSAELNKYHEISAEEYAKYRRNITEKEAFFTQGQRKTTQAELDKMNVEEVMRNQERDAQDNDITEGQIDVPSTAGMRKAASAEPAPALATRIKVNKYGSGENAVWFAEWSVKRNGRTKSYSVEGKTPDEAYAKAENMRDGQVEKSRTSMPLAMEESTPIEITDRWLPAKIRGLFDATRGVGKIKNEIIEHAMDSPAGERMRAEASMGKYDRALIQQAAERGMTPAELNAEIEAAIQKLPQNLEGYDANIAAFNSVADKYGEAGEALKEMRDQIDALSLQMVEDRFASPIPLSAAEQKLYQTILNNLGKYNNRQYAAFAGAAGEKYSKAVWDDYLKRKKAGDVIDDVTEKNYQKVANAVNKLVKDTLYIPDAEGLGRMKAERARRLYNTWIGNPENVELSDIKQALYDKREQINENKPILEQRAETIVKQLLGLTKLNEPIAQYYRGAKTDMGILKKRKEISPEIRELLGEITDPSMAMLMTTAKLAEFTARTKMMLELSADVGGDLLPPQAIAPDNWQTLDGEGFGPLQGYKASPNLHAALSDVAQMHATFEQAVAMAANQPAELGRKLVLEASDAWGKAAKWQKAWQIVANPANFILNFGGGPMLMLQNGNVNPVNMLRGLRDAADLVTYSMNPKVAKPSSIRLVENGVVDSAFIGEIKAEQFRELNTLIKQMSGRSDSEAMALAKKYFTKALAGGKEAYAMADVLYKIANFHHQVDHLTKFYEAEGKDVTPEQIDREAATDVKRTNFTYRRAAPLIKALEQRGFTMFGPYMSEVFRTQVTNILQGIGEIKRGNTATTPEGKRIMTMRGASRIAGQLVSYGLIYKVGEKLASATFGDDEEKESALRSLLPEYLRDQDFGLMGKDENGYPVVYQLSRLDPVGPATDLLRAAYNGDDVTVKDILAKVADTYVSPRLAGRTYELGKAIVTDKAPSREPLAKQVAPEFYSDTIDIAKKFGLDRATVLALTNIGESFMPGFMNSWRDSNGRVVGDTPQDAIFRIASYSGFTFNSLDPSKPLTFAAKDYDKATRDARTRLAEFFRDNPDRTDLEIQNELLRLQKDEYDTFAQLAKVRKGAGVLEYPAAEAAAIMKKARLNTTQMRAIANGDFKSSVVSRESIQRYRDQDLADAKPSERPEIRKRWKEIETRLMTANKNLKRGNE